MDHVEARERLEIAAAEPGGLERLMAGDTPESAALAGHLAGCDACAEELGRLHAGATLIRDVVRTTPPAELRERTLATIRSVGRDRRGAAGAGAAAEPAAHGGGDGRPLVVRRLATLAAVLVVAVAGIGLALGIQRGAELAEREEDVAALERIAEASLRVMGRADAREVALEATGASGAAQSTGTLAFSPETRELVVMATGLPEPPDGREFRCWVESGGERTRVGRMYFANELAFWVGEVAAIADLPPGSRFGVTLVESAGDALGGDPALVGAL
jgi:hypothetical protein